MNTIFLIHLLSCFAMTGIIWLVQVLIYPFFKIVGRTEFKHFHDFHMKKISLVVSPLMLLELITAIWLIINHPEAIYLFNFISVVILWGTTFLINVPAHHKLNYESEESKENLMKFNWIRTIIWSLRSILLFYLFIEN
jgi:hypothetical protein